MRGGETIAGTAARADAAAGMGRAELECRKSLFDVFEQPRITEKQSADIRVDAETGGRLNVEVRPYTDVQEEDFKSEGPPRITGCWLQEIREWFQTSVSSYV